MSAGFVWFQNSSQKPEASSDFYEQLLGWKRADGPKGMTMFQGPKGPFAAVAQEQGNIGWIPYVQVDDVDAATSRAKSLGAKLVQGRTKGPAGDFTVVRDPGGATFSLWQKA